VNRNYLRYGFRFGCGDYCFVKETDQYSDSTERLMYFYVTAIEEYKAGRTKDIAERFLKLYGTGFRNKLITSDERNDILTKVY